MDMIERKRLWFEDEKRAQGDAFIRHLERRARRRNWLRFVFNWRQIVDGPDVPVPSPGAQAPSHTGVSAPPGLGSRAAGFRDVTPTNALTPLTSGSRLPGGPHIAAERGPHFVSNGTSKKPRSAVPHACSEASRISAALNRHT